MKPQIKQIKCGMCMESAVFVYELDGRLIAACRGCGAVSELRAPGQSHPSQLEEP